MTQSAQIIVVDDEPGVRLMLADYLRVQGFAVRDAADGRTLDRLLAERPADLILLDVNMPGEDGISIVGRLRRARLRAGIVVLTAAGEESARIAGLAGGADDYVVKPFEVRELLARIRSVLRRLPAAKPEPPARTVAMGPFRLDLDGRRLLDGGGAAVDITAKEYELLAVFARHPRQILSRERLCDLAHDRALSEADRSIDIRIARLRKKIEADAAAPAIIRTVRGQGYLFEP